MHKHTRITPFQRREIWKRHTSEKLPVAELARLYHVSRPTVYVILERARKREFIPRKSINKRYRCLEYGLKRLAKIEARLEKKLKDKARRYNKSYPGELVHFDTKRLPLLKGENGTSPRQYLFVAIDDYSRELFAAILPDKSQVSSARFLEQVVTECPYTIEYAYSDNGKEYKGLPDHAFVEVCRLHGIGQRFTRVKTPRTNGKAERVIRTLMGMWHNQQEFSSREERNISLCRFVNFYNTVKPHKGIDNLTPYEKLLAYFFPSSSECKERGEI